MVRQEGTYQFAIAALCGLLIAASNAGHIGGTSLLAAYFYWLARILGEAALFIAFRELIDKVLPASLPPGLAQAAGTGLAIMASLVPFVLAVTALDIVLGLPELGLEAGVTGSSLKLAEFGLELVYLFDNHLALCLLLSMPRYIMRQAPVAGGLPATGETAPSFADDAPSPDSFLTNLTPPLAGAVLWAEAQEHYVRLTTTAGNRMVLHRFSDLLRELPEAEGLRVHRSHWVAFAAVSGAYRQGPNLRLKLRSGETIPVSRSYRKTVETALAGRRIGDTAANEVT